ncbi:MAG: futalosine hydrolase [Nitrospirae bacterium]|nr:futalosine hydrolase [Nitrospirota bacterium]
MVNGIIVSTAGEADLLLMKLDRRETLTLQHKPFFTGMLNGRTSAVICICGVGKANAAHGATLLLERFRPDHVYNIGVAGAYPGSGLNIGDAAVAENEFYGDEGLITRSGFHTIDVLGLPLVSLDGINYYNKFPMFVPEAFKAGTAKGNFVSVSSCTGTGTAGIEIERRFDAICENMEGAAVAHICALNDVPVSEIRVISNIIGDRDAKPLQTPAVRIASEKVQQLLLENI